MRFISLFLVFTLFALDLPCKKIKRAHRKTHKRADKFVYSKKASFPYISSNAYRTLGIHHLDRYSNINPFKVKKNDCVYVQNDETWLSVFFEKIHSRIKNPYFLITQGGIQSLPGRYKCHLDSGKILAWFTKNYDGCEDNRMFALPIGLANAHWPHGNTAIMNKVIAEKHKKKKLIYANFAIGTKKDVRSFCKSNLIKRKDVYLSTPKDYTSYLRDLAGSKFVASPRGAGEDCHRTWEAMLLGAIPIVKTSPLDCLFEGLNVLIIKEWDQIPSTERLEKLYSEMKEKEQLREKLFFPYWKNYIFSKIEELRV